MTMNLSLLLYGVIIGLIVAFPFGPIGIVFIQRSLNNSKIEGVFSGLGIATADLIYSITATLGIKALSDLILKYDDVIRFVAIVILCIVGLQSVFKKYEFKLESNRDNNLFRSFLQTFFIALHNASSLVVFVFLFSFFAIEKVLTPVNSITLIVSIFIGSNILWTFLNLFIQSFKKKENIRYLKMINTISGFTLITLSFFLVFVK